MADPTSVDHDDTNIDDATGLAVDVGSEDYLDSNLDDAVELQALDEGEYLLHILDARVGKNKNKVDAQPYLLIRCEAPDYPTSKELTHVMMLPSKQHDDAKGLNKRKLVLKEFFQAVGYDFQGDFTQAAEDVKDATFFALLGVEQNPEYGEQNRIRRMVIGA